MKTKANKQIFFAGEEDLSADFASWYQASFLRFSTRKYTEKAIADADKKAITALAETINAFNDGIRMVPVFKAAPDLFESFGYTKLMGVPAFLAVLGEKGKHTDVKAGFYGEAMCLALTERKLKTCWVSGSIKKKNIKDYTALKPGERFLTSIAFGYGEDKTPETITARRKRKTMDRILEGEITDGLYAKVMMCVQNAPSAINRQPWRYTAAEDQLFVNKPVIPGGPFPEALDIGISMLHASCAAKAVGLGGRWQMGKSHLAVFC